MKGKSLLLKFWTVLTFVSMLGSSVAFGQATLKHSYTFEEGTYEGTTIYDQTGSLDGTMVGSKISIADGKCVVSGATTNTDGYVVFDGVALDLKSYNAVTLEAYVETGNVLNTSYTMLAYFGQTTQGQGCFWIQPTRDGTETRIEANNTATTITANLMDYEVDDGKKHQIVAILGPDALTYYLDGKVIAEASTDGADFISTLGTDIAQLFKGPDGWADPNYNCWLDGFYIYDGVLDEATIKQSYRDFMGEAFFDASLDTLYTSKGVFEPEFDPEIDIYDLYVTYGVSTIQLTALPVVSGADVTMVAIGEEITDGIVSFDKDDGVDVTITVTALDGNEKKNFYIGIFPEDAEASPLLEDIQLSAGSFYTPFDVDSTSYIAYVPPGTTSVDVTGVPAWSGQTVTGGGTVDVSGGMGSTTISVTSEDGTATREYTVNIYVSVFATDTDFYIVHELNSFVAAESGAAQVVLAKEAYGDSSQIWHFEDSGVEDQYYIVNKAGHYICLSRTSANVWDMAVYPDLPSVDLDSARFSLNQFEPGRFRIISVKRKQLSSTNYRLGPNDGNLGSTLFSDKWRSAANDLLTVFKLEVASPYDLYLAELTMNGASLKPVFDPGSREYYTTVPVGISSVEIAATARDTITPPTITGTGTVDVSDGKGTITITVTSATDPQYTREYVIYYISDTEELTLTHSYTFSDGTANDQVGDADGTMNGGTIVDDAFVSAENGDYIILPADKIAINTYPSVTLEAHVMTGANPGWTMLAYFGASGGINSHWISIARNDDISRSEINTGGSVNANGVEPGAGEIHYYVSVLSNDTIFWYIDGSLAAKTALASNSIIGKISTAGAWLAYGGYNDPTWIGSIYEFNIYSGQMDAAMVAERAKMYLGDISTDATLSSLTVDVGDLIPEFDPKVTNYEVEIPEGTTTVNVSAVANDDRSTVEGDGAVDVSSGSGKAAVKVTAGTGFTMTYNIEFKTPTEYALMHSYTFEDGTANDVVGSLDGLVVGNVTIADGKATVDPAANGQGQNYGYISLDGGALALNSYTAITTEAFIVAGDGTNDGYTMMYYFGDNMANYLFSQMTQSTSDISNVKTTTADGEKAAFSTRIDDGKPHHIVAVLTSTSVKYYVDGNLAESASGTGFITPIGTLFANLFRGPDGWNDDNWIGSFEEFNIYDGEMGAATIKERAEKYLAGLTLMHSYKFEDGATDDIGDLDGTIVGNVTIADGMATVDPAANGQGQNYGYISFDGDSLALNSYSAITTEAYIVAGDGTNDWYTMMYYFGDDMANYLFSQMTEGNSNANVKTTTTGGEKAVQNGSVIDDGLKHHIVAVITSSSLSFYVDGVLKGTATGEGFITPIGTQFAHLFRGPDGWNDDNWIGSFEEFNIYEGKMDAATVKEHAKDYFGVSRDASLSSLTVDAGALIPAFNPAVKNYSVIIPEGTNTVNVTAVATDANSTVEGDGAVDVSSGTVMDTIVVTAEDAAYTQTYVIVMIVEDPSCIADLDPDNIVPDPEMTDMSKYAGWGTRTIVYGDEAYCGGSSIKVNGNCGGSLDVDLDATGMLEPNTTYRMRAMVYVGGSGKFKVGWFGDDVPSLVVESQQNDTWEMLDTTFTTGENVSNFGMYFNSCEGMNGEVGYIDNWEVFPTSSTSVAELSDATIKVYPTYSTGDFKVETSGSRGMITIYNLTGKLVLQKMIESSLETVTVRDRGMYIMKVDCDNGSGIFKIFKTK